MSKNTKQYSAAWYQKHRTRILTRRREHRAKYRDLIADQDKERRFLLKLEVLQHYGGARCACCGETTIGFLTIDHTDDSGGAHRKETKCKGSAYYRWLKSHNFPQLPIVVMCYNCNVGRFRNSGICPHKWQPDYVTCTISPKGGLNPLSPPITSQSTGKVGLGTVHVPNPSVA